MKSVQLCILAYVCFAISMVCFADESFNLESILESIPEEERAEFLKYHLAVGYDLTKSGNYGVRDMRAKLSLQIFNYMLENHKVDSEEVLKLLREIICFDDGTCVDIGDVGIHPFR